MKWLLTCREATFYASRALDEPLPTGDRVALRLHLLMCPSCLRFTRQLQKLQHCLTTLQTAERFVYLPAPVKQDIKRRLHRLAAEDISSV